MPKAVDAMHTTSAGEIKPELAHATLRPDYRDPERSSYKQSSASSESDRTASQWGNGYRGNYDKRDDHSRQSGRAG